MRLSRVIVLLMSIHKRLSYVVLHFHIESKWKIKRSCIKSHCNDEGEPWQRASAWNHATALCADRTQPLLRFHTWKPEVALVEAQSRTVCDSRQYTGVEYGSRDVEQRDGQVKVVHRCSYGTQQIEYRHYVHDVLQHLNRRWLIEAVKGSKRRH